MEMKERITKSSGTSGRNLRYNNMHELHLQTKMCHSDERQRWVVELTNYGQRSWDRELKPALGTSPKQHVCGRVALGWAPCKVLDTDWPCGTSFFFLREEVEASREVCEHF